MMNRSGPDTEPCELWSFLTGNFVFVQDVSCLQVRRQTTDAPNAGQ